MSKTALVPVERIVDGDVVVVFEKPEPYRLDLTIHANPDMMQFFPDEKIVIQGRTIKELKERVRDFTDLNCIGYGNWSRNAKVFGPMGLIGRMSYNGCIWDEKEVEVVI